jgi:hypothetical protein
MSGNDFREYSALPEEGYIAWKDQIKSINIIFNLLFFLAKNYKEEPLLWEVKTNIQVEGATISIGDAFATRT